MFAWWGRTVFRFRYIVIGVTVALSLLGGLFGISLGKHVTQSGFYDDGSQSVKASVLGDDTYGRDRTSHIVATFTAPQGKTVDDPAWQKKIVDELNAFKKDHPDQVVGWAGWLAAPTSTDPVIKGMASEDRKHTFVSIPLKGDSDDAILNNYKTIAPDLQKLDNGTVQLAGLEPIAEALTGTIATDQKRMEVLALPLVAVVLFLVFGGVIAAALPAIVGGLSIAGSLGILRLMAEFGPVHYFAQPVVSMMGFGIAIDYGLFVVSRFREEIAEGYDTEAAVRRTVMTAGRTVMFSATLIAVSAASLFLLPQGFVKSLTYAVIISVTLAAILSITLLPACLAILGRNVDAWGVRTLFRIPFLANWKPSRAYLNWLADRLQKTKTREEVEAGFWGKLVNVVMKRPLVFAIPIILAMIALILPLHNLSFGGGISETYLPPDNPVRLAQQNFDKLFPGYRTNQLTLVIESDNHSKVTDQQVAEIRNDVASISGFTDTTWKERACPNIAGNPCVAGPHGTTHPKDDSVRVIQNGLAHASDAAKKIAELRSITPPRGLTVLVGGVPALEQDSIHSLADKAPLMAVVLLTTTMLLMFLSFGSVVLPIKAAVMSALTLGSTLGILTWIFVDGHFANVLNFTPAPLMIVIMALVVAVGFGLATDYEVFLVSRMVEARARGMSTAESIRIGTATTGRLITAAALVLAVVAGSFAFSDLMMMQCLAFGLMAALLLDATVVRMFLVPSVMKLLGDDCWWAPMWMKRLQNRLGLGEIHLPDERKKPVPRARAERPVGDAQTATATATKPRPPHDPTHPGPDGPPRPNRQTGPAPRPEFRPPAQGAPSAAGTAKMPTAGRPEPKEPPTTRFSAQPNASTAPAPDPGRQPTPPGPQQRDDREIESWLNDLRGGGGQSAQPSEDQTRALQIPREPSPAPAGESEDATTAIPTPPQDDKDSDTATEKLNARGENPQRPRRGGGLSAADLLRREGRM